MSTYIPLSERPTTAAAAKRKAEHAEASADLRAARSYSDDGRLNQLAAVDRAYAAELAGLLAADDQWRAECEREATEKAFKPAVYTVESQRVARDAALEANAAAENGGQQALVKLYRAAVEGGSTIHAQAAARAAYGMLVADPVGARGIVENIIGPWSATAPGATDALVTLDELRNERADRVGELNRAIGFRVDTAPELRGMNAGQIAARAALADYDGDRRPPTRAEEVGQRLTSDMIGPPA